MHLLPTLLQSSVKTQLQDHNSTGTNQHSQLKPKNHRARSSLQMPSTRHSKVSSAQWPPVHNRPQISSKKSTKSRPNHKNRTSRPTALCIRTRFHLFSHQSLANHSLNAASLELEVTTIPLTLHSRATTCSPQE